MGTATVFTAKDVSELRQRTGAGMMDCKKALEESQGNMEAAIDSLRTKGIAKAEKRAGNTASEGRIVSRISPDGRTGVMVELNSETDFVARNDAFGALADEVAQRLLADESVDGVTANAEGSAFAASLGDRLKEFSGTIGENIVLRRFARLSGDSVGAYVHHNAKVAAIVALAGGSADEGKQTARIVAEHVTAGVPSVPVGVTRSEVPAEVVDRERRIFSEQAAASGKPENIVQKMVDGRIDKFYKEITLVDQPWIRDDSKTIAQLVTEHGAGATVKRFARFQLGQE